MVLIQFLHSYTLLCNFLTGPKEHVHKKIQNLPNCDVPYQLIQINRDADHKMVKTK